MRLQRFGRDESGNTMIEFALSFALLVPVFLGTVAFGHAFYVYNSMQNAVRSGARYASLRTYDSDSATPSDQYLSAVKNTVVYADPTGGTDPVVPGLTPEDVSVEVIFFNGAPRWVKVDVPTYRANSVVKMVDFTQKPSVTIAYTGRYAPP